jgi:hypothetical protein
MNLSKIPKILYLVLIILMVTIGVIVFSEKKTSADNKGGISIPTTTEPISSTSTGPVSKLDISNWKTYVNNTWKYKLEYPADWYVYEATERITQILEQGVEAKPYIKDSSRLISITVYINRKELPDLYSIPVTIEPETKKITVGGVGGEEHLLTNQKGRRTEWILLEKDGRFYEFIVGMENPRTVEIFNQMLTTFEFIE